MPEEPFNHRKKAEEAGAKTTADVGVFLVGGAAGGIADAIVNVAGFAEPFVFAGFTAMAALGLKKLLWDAPRERNK
jgi:hypothetical protein